MPGGHPCWTMNPVIRQMNKKALSLHVLHEPEGVVRIGMILSRFTFLACFVFLFTPVPFFFPAWLALHRTPQHPGAALLYDPEEFEQMVSRFRCQRTCDMFLAVCLRLDFGGHGPHGHHGCLITPCPHPLDIPMCWPCAKILTRARSM